MDKIEQSQDQDYAGDHFVVDADHRDLVSAVLSSTAEVVDDDDKLGLALIKVSVDEAIRQVRATAGSQTEPHVDATPELPLDRLLTELRALFKTRYDWVPTMGKNRIMRGIQLFPYPNAGVPVPSPHAFDTPMAVDREARPQTTDDLTAGQGVRVGVVDTDLFQSADLAGRYIIDREKLFGPSNEPRLWWTGHAAFVADLILQRAPAAELHVRSVLDAASGTADLWNFAKGLPKNK